MSARTILTKLLFTVLCSWSAAAFGVNACLPGEKRLHETDFECIPASLYNYLTCLGPMGGVEVSTFNASDKSKGYDVKFKLGLTVRLIAGEGAVGVTKENANKLEEAARITYNHDHVQNCATKTLRPPEPQQKALGATAIVARGLPAQVLAFRGHSFSRTDPEVAYPNQGNMKHCIAYVLVQEVLKFDTRPSTNRVTGTLTFNIYQRRVWDPRNTENNTVDMFAAYDKDGAARCQVAIAQTLAAESSIEIVSSPTELRCKERVTKASPNGWLVHRNEGDGPWDSLFEIVDDHSFAIDRVRVFRAN